jgi:hypothetical protein
MYIMRRTGDIASTVTRRDCDRCGEAVEQDDAVKIEDKDYWVCKFCASRHYYRCDDCSECYSNLFETADGDSVCENCLENYHCCETCEQYVDSVDGDGNCVGCEDGHPIPVTCKVADMEELPL